MSSYRRRLAPFARTHHGVFRGEHARLAGLTPRELSALIANGVVERVFKDTYRFAVVPPTWRGDLLAACWAGGFRAAASHRAAAALHGLPGGRSDVLEITCPRWRRARHEGLVVHETKVLAAADLTLIDGIPATTVERTLLDLAGVCRPGLVEMALENALRRELTTLVDVRTMLGRLARSGRPGVRALRMLLDAREPGRRPTESEMETLLVQALRRHGLPDPVVQFEVYEGSVFLGRVDAAYPEARIAIEYDSDEFHTGRRATARDRARRQRLIAAGWLPIEVGSGDLRSGGTLACAAVAAARRDRLPSRSGVT